MKDQTLQLSYAPHLPPWYRRKSVRRRLFASITVLLIFSGFWWKSSIRAYGATWYWDYRCSNYTAPPSLVAYESESARSIALLSSRNYIEIRSTSDTLSAGHLPEPWQKTQPNSNIRAMGFLHSRRSAVGKQAIIFVELGEGIDAEGHRRIFLFGQSVKTMSTAHFGGPNDALGSPISGWCSLPYPVRIFNGQPDSTDVSHFTIVYEVNGGTGTIDGWLQDDGTVKMQVRDRPAK